LPEEAGTRAGDCKIGRLAWRRNGREDELIGRTQKKELARKEASSARERRAPMAHAFAREIGDVHTARIKAEAPQ